MFIIPESTQCPPLPRLNADAAARKAPGRAEPGLVFPGLPVRGLGLFGLLLAFCALLLLAGCDKTRLNLPERDGAAPHNAQSDGVFPAPPVEVPEVASGAEQAPAQPKAEQIRTRTGRFTSLAGLRARSLRQNEARALARSLDPAKQGMKSWNDLRYALEQSLDFVLTKPAEAEAVALPTRPPTRISWGALRLSLARMIELLPFLDDNPALLAEEFNWLALSPDFGFTGYYEPTLNASYRPSPMFAFPIYATPPDLQKGVPYHDRHSIDRKGILSGRGLELAWVRDEMDVFFLQIQGSGRLVFPDGKIKHVLYAGKNGQPYVPLGAILRDKGLLDENNISMPTIRSCIVNNPEQKHELLDMNPSYVFFRLADQGPLGSMGRNLTPEVSLAVDPKVLPYGSMVFFNINLPNQAGVHNRNVSVLGLPQDSGGAIKGRRIDMFRGAGKAAEHIAGYLNTEGRVHILLAKPEGSYTRPITPLR
ncbi:MltA domain-containing protein [Desulfovibrio sp. OttesenSCG-928-C14]|nr:MltA domain-containing protein [Desulfovibrio sp. OttesenSCG-928-C14]